MWQRLFGPKAQQCLVYARPEATFVVARARTGENGFSSCDPVVRLGPRPYPDELGKAVLKTLKASRAGACSFTALPDEPFLTCASDGKALTIEGQSVESEPRRLGETLLQLASRPADRTVELQAPLPLGPRCAWLAAPAPPEALIPALGLRQVAPSTWQEGLQSGRIFVTPQVQGYTLAVGLPYPDPDAEVISDPLLLYLEALSQRVRRVGYFALDPGLALTAWALAEEGTIVRAYAYLGELQATVWRLGLPSEAERELPAFFDETDDEAEEPGYWQRTDLAYPEPRHVLQMARSWTRDPDAADGQPSSGWTGLLSL